MAVLTVEDRARLEWVVRYIERSGGGRYFDSKSVEELAKVFSHYPGFRGCCPGSFVDGLKSAPYLTLLKVLISDPFGFVVVTPEGEIPIPDAVVIPIVLVVPAQAPVVVLSVSLQYLIDNNASVISGDKTFSAFGFQGDALLVNPAEIFVEAVTAAGCLGLRFGGTMQATGATIDFSLFYSVETTNGLPLIRSIGQNFVRTGNGFILIGETVWGTGFFSGGAVAQSSIGLSDTVDPPAEPVQGDNLVINPPRNKVWVTKDILLTPADANSTVGLSRLDQLFCQVI